MDSMFLDYGASPCCFVLQGFHYWLWAKIRKERAMSYIDALLTFLFNVCLPTFDVYSDIATAFSLIFPICNEYKKPWEYYVEELNWKQSWHWKSKQLLLHQCFSEFLTLVF